MAEIDIWGTLSKLLGDICLLLREFVVVSHFTIFPLELLGSAEKPMASSNSSKGKILRWDTFQISGGKLNCLLLPVTFRNFSALLGFFKNEHVNFFLWNWYFLVPNFMFYVSFLQKFIIELMYLQNNTNLNWRDN